MKRTFRSFFSRLLHSSNATWDFTRVFIALVVIVLMLFLCYMGVLVTFDYDAAVWTARGAFGDAFGALNSLLSALAFVGVVLSLYLQYRQMKEARETSALSNVPFLVADNIKLRWGIATNQKGEDPILESVLTFKNVSDVPALDAAVFLRCAVGNGYLQVCRCLQSYVVRNGSSKTECEVGCGLNHVIDFLRILRDKGAVALDYSGTYRSFLGVYCSVSSRFCVTVEQEELNKNRLEALLDEENGLPAQTGGCLPQKLCNALSCLNMVVRVANVYSPVRLVDRDTHIRLAQRIYRSYKPV